MLREEDKRTSLVCKRLFKTSFKVLSIFNQESNHQNIDWIYHKYLTTQQNKILLISVFGEFQLSVELFPNLQ